MGFVPKRTGKKVDTCYMTLYITVDMREELSRIAAEYGTSLNNVVVSMIKQCMAQDEETLTSGKSEDRNRSCSG